MTRLAVLGALLLAGCGTTPPLVTITPGCDRSWHPLQWKPWRADQSRAVSRPS
jgi:hypothetical protein